MIKKILTVAALGLTLTSASVLAATPDSAPKAQAATATAANKDKGPTKERLEAAEALMATGIADQFLDSEHIVDAVISRVKMREPDVDSDTLKTIRKILIEEFNGSKQKMLREFTIMYAANFSVTDLKALTEFYKTPTGQHLLEKTPEIGAESARVVMPFMYHAMTRMRKELMAQMAARQKAAEKAEKKNSADKKSAGKTGEDKK